MNNREKSNMQQWVWNLAYVLYNPRCHQGAMRSWKALSKSQWFPRPELDSLQARRLDHLLEHAQRSVPYYTRILDGMDGKLTGTCRERLAQLPILTKPLIRAHGADLRSRDPKVGRVHLSQTGGSTGEPLVVGNGAAGLVETAGAVLRGKEWAGLRIGDRSVSLKAHGGISLRGRLRSRLLHNRPFSSSLSPEHLRRTVIPALKASPPRYMMGYPTSFLGLAALLDEGELQIPVLLSTGEMLYPQQRELLERTFGGRVFNAYGSNEVSGLAFECEQGQLHITDEQIVFEVVDEAGQPVWDTPGRIVVTDLRNLAMPFIRYELGDRGILTREPCSCGRQLLVLKELEGRSQDAIRGPNGVALSGVIFAGRFRFLKRIRAYQIVQTSETGVEVRYVPSQEGAETEVREIVDMIRDRLGAVMQVAVKPCESLPLTRSGKTRLVVGLGTLDPARQAPGNTP